MTVAERLSLIRDFHKKFGEPIATELTKPSPELAKFRADFIFEEALELILALGYGLILAINPDTGEPCLELNKKCDVDLVKVVDSLRDLEYVMGGLEVALGLQEASEETFLAVHRANMSKQPVDAQGDNRKPTKPPGWQPPDVRGILRKLFPEKQLLFR
jgi:predicted HAD superfamily Cof-like phosphohydrolase